MSTVDANRVILTGENSVIRLNNIDSDTFTTNATFWRILSSPGGPGHVLYLKSELTDARWRIYSDNIAMARWLQSTVLGAINAPVQRVPILVCTLAIASPGCCLGPTATRQSATPIPGSSGSSPPPADCIASKAPARPRAKPDSALAMHATPRPREESR